jgi:hypothetical protein
MPNVQPRDVYSGGPHRQTARLRSYPSLQLVLSSRWVVGVSVEAKWRTWQTKVSSGGVRKQNKDSGYWRDMRRFRLW